MIMLFQDVYDEPSHMCTVLFDRIDNVFTPWSNPISAVLMPLYHRSVHRPGVGEGFAPSRPVPDRLKDRDENGYEYHSHLYCQALPTALMPLCRRPYRPPARDGKD